MMGKAPVWSEKIVLVGWKIKMHYFFLVEDGWVDMNLNLFGGPGVLVFLAEVAQGGITEGGKCFVTSLLVRPDKVEKKPAFIALIHVVTIGLKQIRWYQIARFCLLSSVEI